MLKILTEKYKDEYYVQSLDDFRAVVWDKDKYSPTGAQADYMFEEYLFKLVAGGVRGGKSRSAARSMDWFMADENALVWIIGPSYDKATVEFNYMMKPYAEMGLVESASTPQDGPRRFKLKGGATVETKSALDPVKIASYAPDAILVVEAGACPYEVVDKALERGLEKNAYVILSGTFEESLNWYADLFTELKTPRNKFEGKSYSLPTWSNLHIFPGGRNDPKILRMEKATSEELFLERCAAIPYRPAGLVFREFSPETHVKPLRADPNLPVELAIDPAYHTYAVLFVQRHGEYVHVLDEVYRHNVITQEIIPEVINHPLFEHVTSGVIDQAARQRQGNLSVWQVWNQETGLAFTTHYVEIQQGIDAIKLRMKKGDDDLPRLLFNSSLSFRKAPDGRAGGIITELQMWQWPRSIRTDNKNTRRTPVDKNNDGCKALAYYLFHTFGPVVERAKPREARRKAYWSMKRQAA